ncbi:hypothetical protein QYE76_017722, partial [Lolium multiflorum]
PALKLRPKAGSYREPRLFIAKTTLRHRRKLPSAKPAGATASAARNSQTAKGKATASALHPPTTTSDATAAVHCRGGENLSSSWAGSRAEREDEARRHRRHLFEELLWEHRDLAEAHSKCQAIPEASIEALKTQLAALQAEKEQLIRQHREALDAQETYSRGLKDQLIQDANNSTVVLRAELEEGAKARKAAEDQAARLEGEQKEYDQLVMQTDALALRLFPDSQAFAMKRVEEARVAQAYKNFGCTLGPL